MSHNVLEKPAVEPDTMEGEIQRRLRRGKTMLLLIDASCLLLAMIFVFFVI